MGTAGVQLTPGQESKADKSGGMEKAEQCHEEQKAPGEGRDQLSKGLLPLEGLAGAL